MVHLGFAEVTVVLELSGQLKKKNFKREGFRGMSARLENDVVQYLLSNINDGVYANSSLYVTISMTVFTYTPS